MNFLKNENFLNILWSFFGFSTGFNYFQKEDYLAAGVLFLIGIAYLYRLVSKFSSKN